jgi:hypothetical protein
MKTEQLQWTLTKDWDTSNTKLTDAQLVLVFAGIDIIGNCKYYEQLHAVYPNANIVLISTSGEIHGNEMFENSASATAIFFEKTPIKISTRENIAGQDAIEIGNQITKDLLSDDLKHILLFSEGGHMNGDHLIAGISANVFPTESTAPVSPVDGQVYFDTVTQHLSIYSTDAADWIMIATFDDTANLRQHIHDTAIDGTGLIASIFSDAGFYDSIFSSQAEGGFYYTSTWNETFDGGISTDNFN